MSDAAGAAARPGRETALAALFFLAATVLMTWPQAVHLGDALSDLGDAKLNARILQWDYRQTLRDPANLYQLDFFHPARYVLAFSENLWGVSLFGFPLLAAGASPLLNYNVLLLAGMFLSALSAWALARYVTGDAVAAAVAGLVYAFVPWRFSQLPHLQHQWGGFLCLLLLFLLRYLDHGARRDQVLFGVCFAWNALSNVHYAVFSGFVVVVTLALFAAERRPGRGERLLGAILAGVAGALVFVPFALPYRRVEELYGMKRYLGEMLTYSGRWSYFLSAGEKNRAWGPLTAAWRAPEGDFFPGLAALGLAVAALAAARRPSTGGPAEPLSPARLRAARAAGILIVLAAAGWLAAGSHPNVRLGPLSVGDPGRVLVWMTALVVVGLVIAFPFRARYANVGDWFRRSAVPPRLVLFAALGVVGVLVALGGHTPYYRFFFQSFGQVFRAIRAPSRGIVLFDLALAVLAAWGLALLLRGRRRRARVLWTGAAVAVLVTEYRAFPLELHPVEARAPAVYRWLAGLELPGAVVEWPLGLVYDFDYVFRQAQHQQPLLNGYSGFFPSSYVELEIELKKRPIPDSVWARMGDLGAAVVVYHSHDGRGIQVTAYADAVDRALASGGLEVVASFPHGEGLDFAFIAAGAPWRDRAVHGADPVAARRRFAETLARLHADVAAFAPPFGVIHLPEEGQKVPAGFWVHGWALDDSGIAAVRVSTDAGPAGEGFYNGQWPGLADVYPDYPDVRTTGKFGFALPDLPPGPHRLFVTFVAKDGGVTTIERGIVVRGPLASPRPKGPESRRSPAARGGAG